MENRKSENQKNPHKSYQGLVSKKKKKLIGEWVVDVELYPNFFLDVWIFFFTLQGP